MKKFTTVLFISFLFFGISYSYGQGWTKIQEGESIEIDGVQISFVSTYIKEVKGQDVYQITASLSNNEGDIMYLFPTARYRFDKITKNAWAQFKFTNSTGKGMSSRAGYIYPNPIWMKFPFKCDEKQKSSEYENRVIGVGLESGNNISKSWRVRVSKGAKPQVSVLLKSRF